MSLAKLLVVEDEQLVACDLQETLTGLGYTVVDVVESAEEAIRQTERIRPDLVLMDIRLSGPMDGIEASLEIQSRFHIPVVYLTANADTRTLNRVKTSCPFGYILKPFNEQILSTTIEISLARSRAEQKAQAALQVANRQLDEQSNQLLLVTTKFRNPIWRIQALAENLAQQGDQLPASRRQDYLTMIQSAAQTLLLLLEDLAFLENISFHTLQETPATIDVIRLIRNLIDVWQHTSSHHCQFYLHTPVAELVIWIDQLLLWHVLNNLISNAVKYSGNQGAIHITLSTQGTTLVLQIQDQGIGIPPDSLAEIFDLFQRGPNVGTIAGTGLGLSIVRRCLTILQGEILVDSHLGQGTTVTVMLPNRLEALQSGTPN